MLGRPSLHCYDPDEPHAHLCVAMIRRHRGGGAEGGGAEGGSAEDGAARCSTAAVAVHKHRSGHAVPTDVASVAVVVDFLRARWAAAGDAAASMVGRVAAAAEVAAAGQEAAEATSHLAGSSSSSYDVVEEPEAGGEQADA